MTLDPSTLGPGHWTFAVSDLQKPVQRKIAKERPGVVQIKTFGSDYPAALESLRVWIGELVPNYRWRSAAACPKPIWHQPLPVRQRKAKKDPETIEGKIDAARRLLFMHEQMGATHALTRDDVVQLLQTLRFLVTFAEKAFRLLDEEELKDPGLAAIAGNMTSPFDASIGPKREFDPKGA